MTVTLTRGVLFALLAVATSILLKLVLKRVRTPASLKVITSIPLAKNHSWVPIPGFSFYTQRTDWLRNNHGDPLKGQLEQNAARFHVRSHQVISLAGSDDAHTFYFSRPLSFQYGWGFMYIGAPVPSKAKREKDKINAELGREILKKAMTTDHLKRQLPASIDDCLESYAKLARRDSEDQSSALLDVHDEVFTLVARSSIRTLGFKEAADDIKVVESMKNSFWTADESADFMSVHFAFLPLPGIMKRLYGAVSLYHQNSRILRKRIADGRRPDDIPQTLIDRGVPNRLIVGFVIGALVASMINGSGMGAWMLLFLGADSSLRNRVHKEVIAIMRKIAADQGLEYDDLTVAERLRAIPFETWESEFPLVDSCLKETMRLYTATTAYRFYQGDDRPGATPAAVHGQTLQEGDILSMWVGATHYNRSIYSNPQAFDPDRWARGEGSGKFDFLGWGTGLHPCQGMRFAKLELKILCASFVALFDFQSVDLQGKVYSLETLPRVDPNAQENHLRKPEKVCQPASVTCGSTSLISRASHHPACQTSPAATI